MQPQLTGKPGSPTFRAYACTAPYAIRFVMIPWRAAWCIVTVCGSVAFYSGSAKEYDSSTESIVYFSLVYFWITTLNFPVVWWTVCGGGELADFISRAGHAVYCFRHHRPEPDAALAGFVSLMSMVVTTILTSLTDGKPRWLFLGLVWLIVFPPVHLLFRRHKDVQDHQQMTPEGDASLPPALLDVGPPREPNL